jgi:hypothetical protein
MKKKIVCIYLGMILLIPLLSITATANQPPTTPHITGPTTGTAGVEETYGFCSEDPDGDDITYTIDWDDGNVEEFGPVSHGLCAQVDHTWLEQGTYTIRAKASDGQAESDWGELTVTMPRNRMLHNSFLLRLFEQFINRFPILQYLLGI